jgi:hypothetical protein
MTEIPNQKAFPLYATNEVVRHWKVNKIEKHVSNRSKAEKETFEIEKLRFVEHQQRKSCTFPVQKKRKKNCF